MGGLSVPLYPWPYVDGLAIDEAANELAFITTGMYGKPLPPQNGGPIRMTTPWKYGFKQVKSIVKVTFTDKRPRCFWQEINAGEYGFWANVNPAVSHPRWSQAQRTAAGLERNGADANLQRLWRFRRQLVFRPQVREVVHVTAQRTLAVLAAMLLVGAVALAMLGPPAVPLGQVLFMVDHDLMEAVHGFIGTHLAGLAVGLPGPAADAASRLAGAGGAGAALRRVPRCRSPHASRRIGRIAEAERRHGVFTRRR